MTKEIMHAWYIADVLIVTAGLAGWFHNTPHWSEVPVHIMLADVAVLVAISYAFGTVTGAAIRHFQGDPNHA